MSTPSWLLGRSMTCPFEAITVKPRPRNFESVRDLVGDSTITSDLPLAPGAGFLALGARVPASAGAPLRLAPRAGARLGAAGARAVLRVGRTFAPERAGAAASVSAARVTSPETAFAVAALVRLVVLAMVSFHSRLVAFEGHAHRHVARQLDAHRAHPAAGEELEHALELAVVERSSPSQVDQVAPCLGAQGLALLLAPHALGVLAGQALERRRGGLPGRFGLLRGGRAAQRQDGGLDLVGRRVGLLDRLPQGLERQLLALEVALEPLGEQAQHPRGAVARGAHDRVSTPSSIGMWHFLYFLP